MSDWGSDAQASEELVAEEVEKLLKKNPEHPLLKYWILQPEDAGPDGTPKDIAKERAIQIEMKNRFWRRTEPWQEKPGVQVVTITLTNYWVALRRAVEGKKGDFEPEQKPQDFPY